MAVRQIIETGEGFLTELAQLEARQGKLSTQDVVTLADALIDLINTLNGGLSLGTGQHGSRAGNLSAQDLVVTFPSTPDAELVIPHGLKRKPVHVEIAAPPDRACRIYVSNLGSWSETSFRLKCDVASAVVLLRVS